MRDRGIVFNMINIVEHFKCFIINSYNDIFEIEISNGRYKDSLWEAVDPGYAIRANVL